MIAIFEKIHENAKLPQKHHENDAGYDIFAINDILLKSHGGRTTAWLGLKWKPEFDFLEDESWTWEIQVRPKSGIAFRDGVTVLNTPGTIDQNYRDELGVLLINHSNHDVHFNSGDKIAQLVFNKLPKIKVREGIVNEEDSRLGGFGSSGRR